MTHLSSGTVKARKAHACSWCGERIEPGETYHRHTGLNCGDFWESKIHQECDAAIDAAKKADKSFRDWIEDDGFSPGEHKRGSVEER
jgi:predicted RNA-binding Zn-ribbon protein involved in translation (DUF1610 family)